MKRILALAFASSVLLGSCSPGDNDPEAITAETEYFPLKTGNYWVYNVSGTDFESGRDSLYVSNDTIISGNTCQKLKTRTSPLGFYSNSANNNSIRKINDKIVLTGSTGLSFSQALPVDISLTDFVVFKQSAASGEELDKITGSFSQEFEGFPLTITYALKTIAAGGLPSFTAPDQTVYADLKTVKTILNLKITANIGGVDFPVLKSQDVITATQYYAKDTGVVYTETTISYTLENVGTELDIPQSVTQHSEEVLDIYKID